MPVALVTGASRGIGSATARLLAQTGYKVAINYQNSKEAALSLAQELSAYAPCIAVKADVSDPDAVKDMVRTIRSRLGKIDLLVNNAGIAHFSLAQDVAPETWRRVMGVNLDGAFYASQAVLPDMIEKKQGCIINISSMWGQVGASCEVAYSAAKAGMIGLTKALAKEVGPSGVRVNCIAPGVIDTDMNARLDAQTIHELAEETPLSRIGAAEEIAQSVLFLASPAASFITGQVLGVNGGLVI